MLLLFYALYIYFMGNFPGLKIVSILFKLID